jgi:L-ribulose-5-phosphate 3-epimerase
VTAAARFGVMQGRLSPPENGRFQSFPGSSWRDEFARARRIGLDFIEWIHDAYGEACNPIFTQQGWAELAALKAEHHITTPSLCADWFMEFPLLRCTAEERQQRERHLHALLPVAAAIGADHIVLPLVDGARMIDSADQATMLAALGRALPCAERSGVSLHLEADLNPSDFAAFLRRMPHPMLMVNWDSGNSSGLGYEAREEFAAYGNRIGSVHIKDRDRRPDGTVETRPLGTGSADFEAIFAGLKHLKYAGGFTLQVARGSDHDEEQHIKTQLAFVKQHWS